MPPFLCAGMCVWRQCQIETYVKLNLIIDMSTINPLSSAAKEGEHDNDNWVEDLTSREREMIPSWAKKVYLSSNNTWICLFRCKCGKRKEQKRISANGLSTAEGRDNAFIELLELVSKILMFYLYLSVDYLSLHSCLYAFFSDSQTWTWGGS